MDKLMTYEEVAKQLDLSERFIAKLVSLDEIPYIKIGKAVRFKPSKIQEWLEKKSSDAPIYSASNPALIMKSSLTIVKCQNDVA